MEVKWRDESVYSLTITSVRIPARMEQGGELERPPPVDASETSRPSVVRRLNVRPGKVSPLARLAVATQLVARDSIGLGLRAEWPDGLPDCFRSPAQVLIAVAGNVAVRIVAVRTVGSPIDHVRLHRDSDRRSIAR